MKLFLDTSAIIEFMKNNSKAKDAIVQADELYTSTICAYEVLVGEKYQTLKGRHSAYPKALKFFEATLTLLPSLPNAIKGSEIMAKLMLKGEQVESLDAIIAAQALDCGATILTKDVKHFDIIKRETGLEYIAL